MKVLVVEDDPVIGMDLAMSLEEWGYSVSGPCGSVSEALAAIETYDPEVVLLDMLLRNGESSAPVAEEIQSSGRRVICISGVCPSVFSANPSFASATVLDKPVNPKELKSALAACRRPAREIRAPRTAGLAENAEKARH